ncbi:MAG TPA: flagellar biosynthetic protein FliO [Noviherbaspirillum sp.]|nr:flagellar biosynthetic protein FliO [Noviherbaspirillum sp.]
MLQAAVLLGAPLHAIAQATATTPASAAPSSAGNLLQVLLGLVVVLALMAGTAWVLKRMGVAAAGAGNVARIVGGVSVGNRERVVVVEVADQWIVVGIAPGSVNALSTMPRQEIAATTQEPPGGKNFAAWLKQTIEKRNGN